MFDVSAYQNPYLREGDTRLQSVLSINLSSVNLQAQPVPLALGIVIDRSGSMEGQKIEAAKDAAIRVIQAADDSTAFMVVTFNEIANVIVPPCAATPDNKQRAVQAVPARRQLAELAEDSYDRYLKRLPAHDPEREKIVRQKFKVAPWRLF